MGLEVAGEIVEVLIKRIRQLIKIDMEVMRNLLFNFQLKIVN